MKRYQVLLLALVFGFAVFTNLTTAYADSGLSLTSGSSATTTPNIATSITGFQIIGPSTSTTPVKLYSTSGTLAMTTTTGLAFDGASSGSTIYFSGTVANINAALATLTYTRGSTGTDVLEVSLVNKGEVFFTGNNHLYKFVAGGFNWDTAKTSAEAQTAYGASGYLATITSSDENSFVSARLTGDGWIGASDSATENDWKWVTGPEAGTSFWFGTSGGSTVGGNYAGWAGGEPNQAGEEDCAETYVASGRWNDFPCSASLGYVVEFGTPGTLPSVVAKNISIVTADVPAVTSLSPANGAVNAGANANLVIGFSKTVTKDTGSIFIKRTSDDSLVESVNVASSSVTGGGTNTITINPVTTLAEGAGYYVLIPNTVFKDSSNNHFDGISSKTTWSFSVPDGTAPNISAIVATSTASTSSTITWTTNENASSKVVYGVTSSYGLKTSETNISPRVVSHSRTVSGLLACTTYHYAVVSRDSALNSATSSDASFTTSGCTASAAPSSATSTSITSNTGGSSTVTEGGSKVTVSAPSNFTSTSSSVVIQIKSFDNGDILNSLGRPSSLPHEVGDISFDVKAIINGGTILDSFDAPVTITYQYSDADIAGLNESSLWLYHYHNGAWVALDSCTIDASTNTISCTTDSFSIFSLFGDQVSAASNGSSLPNSISVEGNIRNMVKDGHAADALALIRSQYPGFFTSQQPLVIEVLQAVLKDLLAQRDGKAPLSTSTPAAIIAPLSSIPVRDLYLTMEGNDVRMLQELLIAQNTGPASVELKRVTATGYFSSYTKNALGEYQTAKGIVPHEGYFGAITRTEMKGSGLSGLWW